MYFRDLSISCLTYGLILTPVVLYVSYKVFKGSKSEFAYILLAFSFLDAVNNLAYFCIL